MVGDDLQTAAEVCANSADQRLRCRRIDQDTGADASSRRALSLELATKNDHEGRLKRSKAEIGRMKRIPGRSQQTRTAEGKNADPISFRMCRIC